MKSSKLTGLLFWGTGLGLGFSPVFASAATVPPLELFQRGQAVLEHFGVPREAEPQPQLADYQGQATQAEIQRLLPYFDPWGGFSRFARLNAETLTFYQDADSKQVVDFTVNLAPESAARRPAFFSGNGRLDGLRVALDPGHMGGDLWDRRTQKYITGPGGRRISEGIITLQTALLLEAELRALGAEVFLTRRELVPVAGESYEDFDARPFALRALAESALQSWFTGLLKTSPAGPRLYRGFENSSSFQSLFATQEKPQYFIRGLDIDAREQAINAFRPDITLMIHFDTGQRHDQLSSGLDGTKAYVPGAFLPTELSTRQDRLEFAQHLLDAGRWDDSVLLSTSILRQIRSRLRIGYDPSGGSQYVKNVAPGLFTRNLALTRRIQGGALSYLECFYYNDPAEFRALITPAGTLEIGGTRYAYSDRLVQLSRAIRDGIIEFTQSQSR